MAKTKHKHIPCTSEKKPNKKRNQGTLKDHQSFECDWVVVKKQRITIIIPPLPNKSPSIMPNVIQEEPKIQSPTKIGSHSQYVLGISAYKQPVLKAEKPMSLSPQLAIPPIEIKHPCEANLTLEKPSSLSLSYRIAPDNSLLCKFKDVKGIDNCGTSKMNKGMMMFADSTALLDRRMRASYLDKKLKKAGGLENWLFSLGLGCFVKIFQKKRVNKFQLANLTMGKLRDMGVYAVGPRRKLMHAIDCLCEPHCFQNAVNLRFSSSDCM